MCITTCRRLGNLLRYLPHFAGFCAHDDRFDLLVALDGNEPEYLDFCSEWNVPLVYSDEREGVGISKNRVLERFPGYDYYFFLDDDVELIDGSVFPAHVEIGRASGIHHLSLFEPDHIRQRTGTSRAAGTTIVHGLYGGGQFNFFTREGLERVGGWHPAFAEYRRWGHTEHSYRFPRVGMAPAPFNFVESLSDRCIWHYPPAVTRRLDVQITENEIALPEREIMAEELEHLPVQTLAPHHFNGVPFDGLDRLADALTGGERYPLVTGQERRRCESDYRVWRARRTPGAVGRWLGFLQAGLLWPGSPTLRHAVKTTLRPPDSTGGAA